mmetsp:Transcript_109872/g.343692  ORF Transcript_109872/g.343692 Transcript_109872/m.343692 type:complete len:415 (-) Transcript_109872:266-1510(-)
MPTLPAAGGRPSADLRQRHGMVAIGCGLRRPVARGAASQHAGQRRPGALAGLGQAHHGGQHEVCCDAREDAGRDGEGQGRDADDEEGRQRHAEVREVHVAHRHHHHGADDDEAGRGCLGRDQFDERHQGRRRKKEHSSGHRAEARAAALLHARGRLVVDDHGAGAQEGAEASAQGAAYVREGRARQAVVLAYEAGLLADAVLHPGRVEDDDEQHAEHDGAEGLAVLHRGLKRGREERAGGQAAAGGDVAHEVVGVGQAQQVRGDRDEEDADEQGALRLADEQHGHQERAHDGEPEGRLLEVAQGHQRGVVGHHEAHELEAHEGLEDADGHGDRGLQAPGQHRLQPVRGAAGRQHGEDGGLHEAAGERGLGAQPVPGHDAVAEVGVQAHAGRQAEGQVGREAHEARGDRSREARG